MSGTEATLVERLQTDEHYLRSRVAATLHTIANDVAEAAARIEALEAENARLTKERAELHRAIMEAEPDYSMLSHGQFLEMVSTLHAARAGAIVRAEAAEAELAKIAKQKATIDIGRQLMEASRARQASVARDGRVAVTEAAVMAACNVLQREVEIGSPLRSPMYRALEAALSVLASPPPAAPQGWRPIPYNDEVVRYVSQYGGRCRDCADEVGICPTAGLPCVSEFRRRAIKHVIAALNYGFGHGFLPLPAAPLPAPGREP